MTVVAVLLLLGALALPFAQSQRHHGTPATGSATGGATASTGSHMPSGRPVPAADARTIDPSALTDAPQRFLGRDVRVAGVVDRIAGPREVVLRGEDALQRGHSGSNRILVVIATTIPDVPGRPDHARILAGDPIVVRGRVASLVPIDGTVPRGRDGVGYQREPTLIATRIGVAAS